MTDQNPIQIAVDAIVNCGPREDSTRIGSAGTVRRQAVDVSPLRRVNQAIALLTIGARESAFRNIKTIAECLADELINAAKGSSNSYAIKKKDELERVAKSKCLREGGPLPACGALRLYTAMTNHCCVSQATVNLVCFYLYGLLCRMVWLRAFMFFVPVRH